jgi:lactoylglutathione lyase
MKHLILLLVIVLSSCYSFAQSFSLVHDHSTIQVKDIDQSVEFYTTILNLEPIPTPWPENKMIKFLQTGNHQQLHIAQVDDFGEVKVNKVLHLAFAVNNFDAYLNFLKKKGIKYSNFSEENSKVQTRPDGVRQIYFQDPDGYWIEINDAKH